MNQGHLLHVSLFCFCLARVARLRMELNDVSTDRWFAVHQLVSCLQLKCRVAFFCNMLGFIAFLGPVLIKGRCLFQVPQQHFKAINNPLSCISSPLSCVSSVDLLNFKLSYSKQPILLSWLDSDKKKKDKETHDSTFFLWPPENKGKHLQKNHSWLVLTAGVQSCH